MIARSDVTKKMFHSAERNLHDNIDAINKDIEQLAARRVISNRKITAFLRNADSECVWMGSSKQVTEMAQRLQLAQENEEKIAELVKELRIRRHDLTANLLDEYTDKAKLIFRQNEACSNKNLAINRPE